MQEINDRTQELSVAQRSQTDDPGGCPTCGRPILAVERRGPSSVIISPCGHDVSETFARDFPRKPKRAAADGGELTCEVTEANEHSGDVKIVLDDAGDVLAMCARCRREFGYQRVIDEDPEAAICDGGVDVEITEDSNDVPVSVETEVYAYVRDGATAAIWGFNRTVEGEFQIACFHVHQGSDQLTALRYEDVEPGTDLTEFARDWAAEHADRVLEEARGTFGLDRPSVAGKVTEGDL